MRFRKNVPPEHRKILKEQFETYKKETSMTSTEMRELEKWIASGHSPYDNGDYIYTEQGYPMDFISALRFQDEQYEWLMSLSAEEREKELQNLRSEYDTVADDIMLITNKSDFIMDSEEELPFE